MPEQDDDGGTEKYKNILVYRESLTQTSHNNNADSSRIEHSVTSNVLMSFGINER